MPSLSSATLEMRCSFAACAISISDDMPASPESSGWNARDYRCSELRALLTQIKRARPAARRSAVNLVKRRALAVARISGPRTAPGHLHGAVLEFRNLAERIEFRIGQQVCRRFVE